MVKIGDYWGKKYDYITNLPKYIRFRLTTGVKLKDWRKCMEAIEDPRMYLKEGFIPSKNDVILDIGAQYGDYAMIWSKKYGCMVHSFEIAPENFSNLILNIANNRSRVKAYNIALGNGESIKFDYKEKMSHKNEEGQPIQTVRVDDWVHENKIRPDILKIDVEGAEYEVLQGAQETISSFHPKIILETHSRELREKCEQFMKSCGYKLKIEGRTEINYSANFNEVTNLYYLKQ